MLADVEQPVAQHRRRPGFASSEEPSPGYLFVALRREIQQKQMAKLSQTQEIAFCPQEGSTKCAQPLFPFTSVRYQRFFPLRVDAPHDLSSLPLYAYQRC